MALRPLGSPRLELAAGVRLSRATDDTRWLGPHGRRTWPCCPAWRCSPTFDVSRADEAGLDEAAGARHGGRWG